MFTYYGSSTQIQRQHSDVKYVVAIMSNYVLPRQK